MDVFQQQGELDYVSLSNSIVSNTLLIAQRLSAAGISPITHQAGLAMSTRFRLGQMGQLRISQALKNLRPYFGFERALWFGFGHKSFLSLLTEHQAGVNCAALCASLAEVYGVDRSALLLQALWQVQGLSESLEPSRTQFKALVNGCAGLLLATPFPDVVRRMAGSYIVDGDELVTRLGTRSEDWAKAVDAIFQVSKGSLKAVRVYGGRDVAFIGAIAHWLFDLPVWVELPDGTTTFSSCRYPEQANVHLHYADTWTSEALLKVSSTTFILRTVEDLIVDDPYSQMTFRIQWSSCLSDLFYVVVDDILDNAALIGGALGAIARIYEALRKCEVDVGGLSRTHFIHFQPAGYGQGFIDKVCSLFPELSTTAIFRTRALESLHMNVPTCVETICKSIENMTARCGCQYCGLENGPIYLYQNCCVAVFFFIRTVATTMAHADTKTPINPSRNGLERIYSECLGSWRPKTSRQHSSLLELASGLPHAQSARPGGMTHTKNFLLDNVLQEVCKVLVSPVHPKHFGLGLRAGDEPQCTAIVTNGVCLWIDALRDPLADPASMATIHIAPGQIVYKDWSYTSIRDVSHAAKELLSSLTPVCFGKAPTSTLQEEPNQPHHVLRILAEETAESGTIRLAYGLNEESINRYIQPGIITEEILMATARVPCPQGAACSDAITLPCWQRKSGWNCAKMPEQISHHASASTSPVGFVWNASSPLDKLLAIEGCRILAWHQFGLFNSSAILLRSEQCMACMTRYMTTFRDQASWEHLLYYRAKLERRLDPLTEENLFCALHII
ncbi:hypothetical protein MMC27_004702 [Xylographa pallens]|nr:hypothetical protein [Xylographa pallens]